MPINNKIQLRRGISSAWNSINDGDGPVLAAGEPGFQSDSNLLKIGDGSTSWKDLKPIGSDQSLYKVKNTSGGIIYKGQVVRANGTVGNSDAIQVTTFIANGSVPEYTVMGLATQDMNNNDFGYVTAFGQINNIDTNPANSATNISAAGETWVDGDILYASPAVSGKLTKIKPQHDTIIAIVLNAADNGSLFVRPSWNPHLDDVHDVNTSGVSNNQYLRYDSGTDTWLPTSSGIFNNVYASGNVGIGTNNPSTKLDVSGVITATSGNSTNWNVAFGWGNHASAGYLLSSLKGANNGVAELDSTGRVPSSQLPSYVDDVLEFAATGNFPVTGETGKIYVATGTNLTYRWSGSSYVEISASLALGETSSTAYRGDRGKEAYDHSQLITGSVHGSTTVGGNLLRLSNPSAIRFLRVNADNTIDALTDSAFRTAIGAGTSSTTGTVTSIGGTGTVAGLTLTGTVTTTGNLTLGGTLSVAASNFSSQTANTFLAAPNSSNGVPTFRSIVASDIPTLNQNTTGNASTVTNGVYTTGDQSIGGVKTFTSQINVDTINATSGNLIIAPSGTGALVASTTGNSRGANSVDLQTSRTLNTQVASGTNSVISGGKNNTASATYSTVGGGLANTASGYYSTVSGGYCNTACGIYSTVGGGQGNTASVNRSTVGGGFNNTASGYYSTVGGGVNNTTSGYYSTVSGGCGNTASGSNSSTVSGGRANTASTYGSTVGGGSRNVVNARHGSINGGHSNVIQSPTNECCSRGATIGGGVGHNSSGGTVSSTTGDITGTITCCNAGAYSTIGGGLRNIATGDFSTVSGGSNNTASGTYSTVGGGQSNKGCGNYSTIGGGQSNKGCGSSSTVSGGYLNTASGTYSTVGGGSNNTASGIFSTVGGGNGNTASGDYSTVGGGGGIYGPNTASGYGSTASGGSNNTASGISSTVGGGNGNTASGNSSTVGGGYCNTASGIYSTVSGGLGAKTSRYGEVSHASGQFASIGDAQHSTFVARNNTTNATANVELFLNGSSERMVLSAEVTWAFSIKLSAYNDTDNTSAWWIFRGGIRRNASNGTTLIGSVIEERDSEGAMSGTSASVTADDTNESLKIAVTGLASKNIRWVAVVDVSQVSWGTP